MESGRSTLLQMWLRRLQNTPIVAGAIIGALVLAGVAAALQNMEAILARIFPSPAAPMMPASLSRLARSEGPFTLKPGESRSVPVRMRTAGRLDVTLESLVPDWTGFDGVRGAPGHDGLSISVCPATAAAECQRRQLAAQESMSLEMPTGPASVSIFNFADSPTKALVLRVEHPE